ncbi:trypsin-like serine peptidase [Streptacidiphilus jiangxiensis]|uniref:V8-like Glu-specific endopeptidase n=1 Tax=Streptacidiphilus jiangxiensis TaxID=235985 RepID=A0A1H7RZV2_STRJI|nr:trypsin-like peptidase domain-containing protein [Streptacidiphilus jiangxiensis]SEL64897.1 V8-like Glu-specific endopeptidase [Streptacidiphilus jiangxiensis]
MTFRSLAAAGALLALLLTTPESQVAAAGAPDSTAFGGASRVGAIFGASPDRPDHHFCSGAVVDSPTRNIVVTAAHCVMAPGSGRARGGLTFVPGYHEGARPFGTWSVATVVADSEWTVQGSQDSDVAFLILRPDASGRRIQDVAGAEALAFNPAGGSAAVAVGYPSRTDQPVFCSSRLQRFTSHQFEFDCPGLPGGTSGAPLLLDTAPGDRGHGTVAGVIGGYEEGGDSNDVSYATYFGPSVAAVYRAAVSWG